MTTMSEKTEMLRARLAHLEEIAARLDEEAHMLRELGRYGQRALGEGEHLVQALWGICDRLREVEYGIDHIARRIAEDESA